jgi:hypothetical protein
MGTVDVVCWKKNEAIILSDLPSQEKQSFEKQGGTGTGARQS